MAIPSRIQRLPEPLRRIRSPISPREAGLAQDITFARLSEIEPAEILAHMSDPQLAEHMPLLTLIWDAATVETFVAGKEARWHRDGLGHWAILFNGQYVGWGGFQKEGEEWDFGLVLRPEVFGLGPRISRQALDFAKADHRIP